MSSLRAQALAGTLGGLAIALTSTSATAGFVFNYFGDDGLSAEAEFSLSDGGTKLVIRLKNTSTGVPGGFSNSDQILTAVSWDFGHAGYNGDVMITGGTVLTGPTSSSVNFDIQNVGPNEDVSGEYGYGNTDGTGLLPNFVTASIAQATPFGGANLDGSENINGPQGGLVSSDFALPLGGLGAIQDEIIASLTLDQSMTESELLGDLLDNGTLVEFGSDAAYVFGQLPAPGALALLALAGLSNRRRRRA